MTEAPADLENFFAKKAKKKAKASNFNDAAVTLKPEEKKLKQKDRDEEGWEEEQVLAHTMKVEAVGKLTREDEKNEVEETAAPAWDVKQLKTQLTEKDTKKFPTLAKAIGSTAITIDDTDSRVNIKVSRNAFQALDGDTDSDDEGLKKRPKEINSALVKKEKGEFQKSALEREANKYGISTKKEEAKKKKKDKKREAASSSSSDDDDTGKKNEKVLKEQAEDVKIQPDLVASRLKYKDRVKLPRKELSVDELAWKENRVPDRPNTSKATRKRQSPEEIEEAKTIEFAPDDW